MVLPPTLVPLPFDWLAWAAFPVLAAWAAFPVLAVGRPLLGGLAARVLLAARPRQIRAASAASEIHQRARIPLFPGVIFSSLPRLLFMTCRNQIQRFFCASLV